MKSDFKNLDVIFTWYQSHVKEMTIPETYNTSADVRGQLRRMDPGYVNRTKSLMQVRLHRRLHRQAEG